MMMVTIDMRTGSVKEAGGMTVMTHGVLFAMARTMIRMFGWRLAMVTMDLKTMAERTWWRRRSGHASAAGARRRHRPDTPHANRSIAGFCSRWLSTRRPGLRNDEPPARSWRIGCRLRNGFVQSEKGSSPTRPPNVSGLVDKTYDQTLEDYTGLVTQENMIFPDGLGH